MLNAKAGYAGGPRFMRRVEVQHVTGLPRGTIYQYLAAGRFPKPIKISGRTNVWLEAEILKWMAERIAERDGIAA
jgi:prophage regulatory protein